MLSPRILDSGRSRESSLDRVRQQQQQQHQDVGWKPASSAHHPPAPLTAPPPLPPRIQSPGSGGVQQGTNGQSNLR